MAEQDKAPEVEEPTEPPSPSAEDSAPEESVTEATEAADVAADNGDGDDEGPGGVTLIDPNPELTEARQEVQSLQARLRAVSAAYKQLQDDVQATKERLERQAQLRREMQRGETVATLFDPLDNLKRSIDALNSESAANEDTRTGFTLVANQFMEAFRGLGLEEVAGKGSKFDPNLHEAISVLPVTDPELDEQVMEVFSAGYRVGSRLLKPARVVIGRIEEAAGDA